MQEGAARQSLQSIERGISRPNAQRSEQRAAGQDVASRKLILRAFTAKLIADTDGGSKGAGLHLSQASRDQACNENLPTIKKVHTVLYAARSGRHSAG
jgi:hypothetical protein